MKLSSRARHALRLALEVSRRSVDGNPVRLSEVARVTGLSRKFLEQLAIALKSHALIRGVSGRNGGYLLARPADEITIGQVIYSVTGPLHVATCVDDLSICMSSDFCECRLVWRLLQKRIQEVLDEYTLADFADQKKVDALRARVEAV